MKRLVLTGYQVSNHHKSIVGDFKDIQTIGERTGKGRGRKRDSVLEI